MRLTYVYKDKIDNRFYELCEHYQTNDIDYDARQFNSFVFEEDREYIITLPAIHIYTNKGHYYDTVHVRTKDYIQHINAILIKIKERKEHVIQKFIAKFMSKKIISRFK